MFEHEYEVAMRTTLRDQAASTISVEGDSIVIRIAMPQSEDGVEADQAALLQFAARADSFQGFMLWQRYVAAYRVWQKKVNVADAVGADSFSRVYDPMCQTAASYAVLTGSKQYTAERFVDRAIACVERVPELGKLMRDGVITPVWFHAALAQTEAVLDDDVLAVIDHESANRLRGVGGLSKDRVTKIVNGIVAEHDADAARAAREAAKISKRVITAPVDGELSGITITATTEDAALVMRSLDAVAEGVCADDPRTKQVRRSDAAVARLSGAQFTCRCGNDKCPARLSDDEVAARCAKIVLHVVARRETLTGEAETPAYLDGFGPISGDHAREIAGRSDTVARDLDIGDLMDGSAQAGNGYRPTATCDTAVRTLHGQCSMIGCDAPAWECDLDHVQEYDHIDPASGGPTCPCNLNPKCRFHHGLKTHVPGWVDDQIVDANGTIWTEVTTPEGLTVRSQALNTWLLPELGLLPCNHPAPTRGARHEVGPGPQRELTRTQAKHRYRMQIRAANRRARGAEEAEFAGWGEPQF
ncbi:13E12 repeat family protein [Gordonia sp. HY002]|uniref:DUF222 domain-containing protein n=1 Tax=Gordonia zhenghanii TaxID=2911516 RepID=UPI001EF00964|nr:DUF222 domain-containing protein [Gordonia zhenghanii]MCF8569706.1 13E12 repeat family protein [Gordonia zhenghanii]MCF8606214.1 13E12 repeat family protein [Gordonia zhenghanii]